MRRFLSVVGMSILFVGCGANHNASEVQSVSVKDHVQGEVLLPFGSFTLYENPKAEVGNEYCEMIINLDIINGPTGATLRVSSGVIGVCKIHIAPNPREFDVVSLDQDSCGTRKIRARRVQGDETFAYLELTDHRHRICDDYRPHTLEASEVYANGDSRGYYQVMNWQNLDNGQGFTCMAYWTGYEINHANVCSQVGMSGCSNPFRFTTLEQCSLFYRL